MDQINFHDYFYYDETSPTGLRWKVSVCRKMAAGQVAGCYNQVTKRYQVRLNKTGYSVSRIIYNLFNPDFPVRSVKDRVVDHIDGNAKNNVISNLREVTIVGNNRNVKRSTKNTSGVVGVHIRERVQGNKTYYSAVASWIEMDGTRKTKHFSIARYGEEQAKKLASAFRDKKLQELNAQGAGYSERHGR